MWKYNETNNLPSYEIYHTSDELYHYGVLGMRWRHKKAQWQAIRDAKRAYKQRNANIQNKYFKSMENIEKGYKRGQMLSKKDQARELKADNLATNGWKKSKAQLKSDIAKAKARFEKNVNTSKTNRDQAKKILAQAKANYKAAYKQYSKDFNKSSTLFGAWGPGNKERHHNTYESAKAANKAYKEYKKAKTNYKKFKKSW